MKLAFICGIALAALLAGCDDKYPDQIFINTTVITLNPANDIAEALATKNGRIVAVGKRQDLAALAGPTTEVIDLKGKTLLPGFVAAHEHPAISAVFRNFIDMSGFRHASADAAWQALKQSIDATPKGEWVYAKGLDPVLLAGLQPPTRQQLDTLAPENPVFILAQSMHTAWVNSAALAAMEIDEQSPDPGEGSYYGRDDSGRLNGQLVEKQALEPFIAPHKSPLKLVSAYEAELDDLRAAGYTSVASLGFNVPAWLARWTASDHLKPRIRQFFYYRGENLAKLDGQPQTDGDAFRVLGAKFWYDGSPYSGSMVVEQPYQDSTLAQQLGIAHGSHGEPVVTPQELQQKISELSGRGWQIASHVQGDRAAREYLQMLRDHIETLPVEDRQAFIARRHRLEHGLLLGKELLPAFAALGITPSFHINHLYYYGDALQDELLGAARAEKILPLKTAFDLGMHPTLHADSPMFPAEPFSLMQTAIRRESRAGTLIGADEAITPLQALRAMTINAAWQLGMEKDIGSLEAGKFADLVIVDKNPLTTPALHWREIRVQETRIAGRR
ncbi:amidohydrolase [Microbulbifer sp. CAU 1566]|uniref:amidohydrolase n=1 Tax=Microbulbifer sp. CAU 1566 TaxID=2933269 RepID=UPI002005E089|nr:amidohydrolase [Microbulbifer sp. CAU 1566]MCK7599110.1 amidohydrolase [Microbulbifer sp. CAU 1566]